MQFFKFLVGQNKVGRSMSDVVWKDMKMLVFFYSTKMCG